MWFQCRLEALSVQERRNLGVDVDSFARNFVEVDFVKAKDMFQIAAREENDAIRMNGDLERGTSIPVQKIKAGLDANGAQAYRFVEGSDESLNKIGRGVESRRGAVRPKPEPVTNLEKPDAERYFSKPEGAI